MIFDLQRFGGGKGGVTYQTSSYEPTVYELKLQELQVGFVEGIMPNASDLNTAAKNLLLGSIGEQPLDFAEHLNQAHTRYDEAYAALYAGAEWIATYLSGLNNNVGDFSTINTAFADALTNSWDSENYTDIDGNKKRWVGFWDFAAHILYDNADNGLNEIGETMRAVVNGANQHFHDVINNFQVGFEQEMNNYGNLVSTVKGVTFEDTATLNADELDMARQKVGLADQIFINSSNELPAVIEDAAVSVNSDFNGRESTVSTHAETNYTDLDDLIPKFTVTSDIVDSLIADAADDLKRVRDANYNDLDTLPTQLDKVESDARVTLIGYIGDIEPVKIANYDTLNGIADDFKINIKKI